MTVAPRIHTLANGVKVLCDPAPGFETFALSVVAGRGARWEDEARSGWSHLLEHMVFKGAGPRSARELVECIESDGGHLNAATGHERTSFQIRALKGGMPLAMEVMADMVRRPTLDADDLAKEKLVVGQEIAEAADTPDDQVFELAQSAAFARQPLGRPILGTVASLEPTSSQALGAWRAALYSADRLIISAAGAVDEDELLRLTEALYEDAPRAGADPFPAASFIGGEALETRKLEQAHLVIMLPAPGVRDPDYWALRVFAEALGGGMSSRLFQEARERLGLAYAIDGYAEAYDDVGVLGVYAGCAAKDAGRLVEVAAAQIRALTTDVTASELHRAKSQLKSSLFMSRESLLARAEQAAAQVLVFGSPMPTQVIADAIDGVTAEAIARVGAAIMAPGRAAVSVLGPKAAGVAAKRFEAALFG